eukprot:Skav218758  [mRNA]  locus=scaffold1372:94796:116532:- [translate_table: standard]
MARSQGARLPRSPSCTVRLWSFAALESEALPVPKQTYREELSMLSSALDSPDGLLAPSDQHRLAADAFLEVLAVAHTVMIATNNKGEQYFEAESPDEGALVEGAEQLGWRFCHRTAESIILNVQGQNQTYQILAVNSFNSTRKRMSTVARAPDGRVWLWVKGADNVMMARATSVPEWIHRNLNRFSEDGLRTLVLGRRLLSPSEVDPWLRDYDQAQFCEDRDSRLEDMAERIEKDLELLGITGIEDKLQSGVPDTIVKLQEAGVQLWVLTGDKLETARNIGFSTRLLSSAMDIGVLTGEDGSLETSLEEVRLQHLKAKESSIACALMLTGAALEQITHEAALLEDFLKISKNCNWHQRNAVITMLLFYYTFFSGYSGTCMFTSTVWTSFSMILFWPVIATGIFDRDVTAAQALRYPALYETGRLGLDLNLAKMVEMLLSAFVHSLVIMTVAVVSFGDLDIGATGSYYSFSFMIFAWLILTMNYRITFITTTYNWVFLAALLVSFATFALFVVLYSDLPNLFPEVYGLAFHVMQKPLFWMGTLAVPLLAMMIDMFKAYLMLEFFPDTRDLILENSVKGELSGPLRKVKSAASAIVPPSQGASQILVPRSFSWQHSASLTSSFAFSYPEGTKKTQIELKSTGSRLSKFKRDTSFLDHPERLAGEQSLSDSEATSTTSAATPNPKFNRPSATRFAQQTMKSVQFVLDWKVVFASSSAIGFLFLCMGLGTLLVSLNASQLRILYDGPTNKMGESSSSYWDFIGRSLVLPCHAPAECSHSVKLPVELRPPIQVYYEVKPFWQNYFSYMSSVVPTQLHGELSLEEAAWRCPLESRKTGSGEEIFPCGLLATSVFNDTFEIQDISIDTESEEMPVWRSFQNPPEYLTKPNMSWLYERYPSVTSKELGVESKRFISWMMPNFLNRASKPYGVISSPLKKDQVIELKIKSRFPLAADAWKTVLFTRGTQNYVLAVVLLVSGGLCFSLAFGALAIHLSCARERGSARERPTSWPHMPWQGFSSESTSSGSESA